MNPLAKALEWLLPSPVEQKAIIGLGDGLPLWAGSASRQDGTNFRTNMVTLAEYQDSTGTAGTLGMTATWACINLLAGTIASLPLMVYRTVGSAREVARDHPLYRLLHDRPNFDQTAVDFLEFMCAALELHGNAYAEKRRTGARITSLVPIRPDLVVVRRVGAGLVYTWTDGGVRRELGQEDMLHVRGFGGGPLGGASALSVCRAAFASASAVERSARAMFANGVRPSGIMTKDGPPFTAEQRKTAEGLLQEKFVGAMNDGRPMLLDNGLKWQQLTINPEDAQMLESRKFSVEEICRVFGVPPHMIGHTENSTSWGTGLEQQTLGFQKFTLRRRLKRIEQAFEQQLLTEVERRAGITVEFNLEGLLRADSKARAEFYKSALGNTQEPGWMTRNEVRRLENLPPVDGWDDPIPLITDNSGDGGGSAPPALPARA